MSNDERQCTHVDCEIVGIGRVAETSSHWLCEIHLETLKDAIATWYKTGDRDDMKKMLGMTVRAGGGAKKMAAQMLGEDNDENI